MKKGYYLLIATIIISNNIFANSNTKIKDPSIEVNAKTWMTEQNPLGFQENQGQMADNEGNLVDFVLFKAEVPNLNIWITNTGITYQFLKLEEEKDEEEREGGMKEEKIKGEWHRVDMVLKGASINKANIVTEKDITQSAVNYYMSHCPNGIFNVKTYAKIIIKEVYPGIDWVLYTSEGTLKHDFIVHPHAESSQIKLIYEGSGKINIKDNQIHFENELGEITEGELLCYQGSGVSHTGAGERVKSNYVIRKNASPLYLGAGNLSLSKGTSTSILPLEKVREKLFSYEIAIKTENYNRNEVLIIDPQLVWATFYGGSGAEGPMSSDCDGNGFLYVTGYTGPANNFPVMPQTGAYYDGGIGGFGDAFILRFNNLGVRTWATYYGATGFNGERGLSIALDAASNIYVTGETSSPDFPIQPMTGAFYQPVIGGQNDAFILRFDNLGLRTWATFYGGPGNDRGYCIDVDVTGNVYVTGDAGEGFPIINSPGAYYQSVYGGLGNAFVLRFNNLCARTWATYYGGSGDDTGYALALDAAGNLYVTGETLSTNFPIQSSIGAYYQPTKGAGQDAFISRFNNSGALTWATYYGGGGDDIAHSIALDASGNIYVHGTTGSTNFPLQPWAGAYNDPVLGGLTDAFILRFNSVGARIWATYYGGSAAEALLYESADNLAIDNCGNVYASVATESTDIYTFVNTACGQYYDATYNGGGGDLFIIKFNNAGAVLWATYFGGDGQEFRETLALDNTGNLFIAGEWTQQSGGLTNVSYPLTNPGGGAYFDNTFNAGTDDLYIAKFIPAAASNTQSQVNATSCSPCNGTATITISCGDPKYSYVWSNGSSTLNTTANSNTITGLCPGNYTVTTTSNCNQVKTANFIITGTVCGGITATATGANICSGACATITSNGSSGSSPYIYLWSNGATSQNISPCPAATSVYTVTITDATAVSATATATAVVNPAITVTSVPTNISCSGGGNGSILANPTGGTLAYTYSWSDPGGQTTQTATGLIPGNYTVTITDARSCTTTTVVAIISPPTFTGQFSKGTANCMVCGCKEWIMVNASGGTSPYSYSWSNGYSYRYQNYLCPGGYTILITDKNGCSINISLNTP